MGALEKASLPFQGFEKSAGISWIAVA